MITYTNCTPLSSITIINQYWETSINGREHQQRGSSRSLEVYQTANQDNHKISESDVVLKDELHQSFESDNPGLPRDTFFSWFGCCIGNLPFDCVVPLQKRRKNVGYRYLSFNNNDKGKKKIMFFYLVKKTHQKMMSHKLVGAKSMKPK